MITQKPIIRLIVSLALLPAFSFTSGQETPRIWAAISVSEPLFQAGSTKQLMIHFSLVNDGARTIDPKVESWRIVINGEELADPGLIFGNGPRDTRWKGLSAGDNLRFSYGLEQYFKGPGIYRVTWKGDGFETLPIEFRVTPNKKRE